MIFFALLILLNNANSNARLSGIPLNSGFNDTQERQICPPTTCGSGTTPCSSQNCPAGLRCCIDVAANKACCVATQTTTTITTTSAITTLSVSETVSADTTSATPSGTTCAECVSACVVVCDFAASCPVISESTSTTSTEITTSSEITTTTTAQATCPPGSVITCGVGCPCELSEDCYPDEICCVDLSIGPPNNAYCYTTA